MLLSVNTLLFVSFSVTVNTKVVVAVW